MKRTLLPVLFCLFLCLILAACRQAAATTQNESPLPSSPAETLLPSSSSPATEPVVSPDKSADPSSLPTETPSGDVPSESEVPTSETVVPTEPAREYKVFYVGSSEYKESGPDTCFCGETLCFRAKIPFSGVLRVFIGEEELTPETVDGLYEYSYVMPNFAVSADFRYENDAPVDYSIVYKGHVEGLTSSVPSARPGEIAVFALMAIDEPTITVTLDGDTLAPYSTTGSERLYMFTMPAAEVTVVISTENDLPIEIKPVPNGPEVRTEEVTHGEGDREVLHYDQKDRVIRSERFLDGVLALVTEYTYYNNGAPASESVDDARSGFDVSYREWNADGSLHYTAEYKNGVKERETWFSSDTHFALKSIYRYENGSICTSTYDEATGKIVRSSYVDVKGREYSLHEYDPATGKQKRVTESYYNEDEGYLYYVCTTDYVARTCKEVGYESNGKMTFLSTSQINEKGEIIEGTKQTVTY